MIYFCFVRFVFFFDSFKAGLVFIFLSNVWVSVEFEKFIERYVFLGGVFDFFRGSYIIEV